MDYKKRYQRLINLSFHSYNKWMQLTQRVADLQHTATVNSGVLYLGTNEVSKLITEMKKSTEPLKQELTGLLNDKIKDDLTASSAPNDDNEPDDDPFMNYHAKASDIPTNEQASDDVTISRDEYDRLKAQNSLYQDWIDADALSRQNEEKTNEFEKSTSASKTQSTNTWDQTIPGEEPASKTRNTDNINTDKGESIDQSTVKQLANNDNSNDETNNNDDVSDTTKTDKKEIKANVGEDGRLHLDSKVDSEEIENPAVPDKVVNDDASDIANKVSESAKHGREEDTASIENSVNDVSKQINKMNVDDISDESVDKSNNDKSDNSSNDNKSTSNAEDADENALLTGNNTNDNTNAAPLDEDTEEDDDANIDDTDDEDSEALLNDALMNPNGDDSLNEDDTPF